jgi:hypothetical protein
VSVSKKVKLAWEEMKQADVQSKSRVKTVDCGNFEESTEHPLRHSTGADRSEVRRIQFYLGLARFLLFLIF